MSAHGKTVLVLLGIAMLSMSAWALTVTTDKDVYEKGETIDINGTASTAVVVTVSNGNTVLAEQQLVPENGEFELSYDSTFLDPSGEWTIKVKGDGTAEKTIQMNLSRKSAYHVITFFSPSTGEHSRSKEIGVNVEVTDAGNPVLHTTVVAYGALGEKLQLESKGSGRYSLNYIMPFNTPLGELELVVVSSKGSGEEIRGGENRVGLSIVKTPILLEVVRPSAQVVGLGENTAIVVRPVYFNGLAVDKSAEVSAKANGEELVFARENNGEYVAYYTPKETGELKIELNAVDAAGNHGKKVLTVIVGGDIEFFIGQYWVFIVAIAAVLAVVLYKAQSKAFRGLKLNSLRKQKQEAKLKLKKVEQDYFKTGSIDRPSFDTASSKQKSKLAEIDEKIRHLTKKKEIKKTGK